jgi:ketosteroid isomerase-like protein
MTVAPTVEPVALELEPEIRAKLDEYTDAYQARDLDRLMALFADDAEVTLAPGTFRGKDAIRKLYEWDAKLSPAVRVRDSGIGVLVSGRTAVRERVISLTYEGIPYEEEAATIYEFDDAGLIRRQRSYYDKLALMHQIASRYPGIQGRIFPRMTGYLLAQGRKGLDVS